LAWCCLLNMNDLYLWNVHVFLVSWSLKIMLWQCQAFRNDGFIIRSLLLLPLTEFMTVTYCNIFPYISLVVYTHLLLRLYFFSGSPCVAKSKKNISIIFLHIHEFHVLPYLIFVLFIPFAEGALCLWIKHTMILAYSLRPWGSGGSRRNN
jgi:hypothetical protein